MTEVSKKMRKATAYLLRAMRGRMFWAVALAVSFAAILLYVSSQAKVVYIQDGDQRTLHHTFKREPEQILEETGIATMAFDVVDFTGFEGKLGLIEIKRAFEVSVKVDGQTHYFMTTDDNTVGSLLKEHGISLGEYDIVSVPQNLHVCPGDHIVIQRVEVTTTTVEEAIPYETVYKDNSLLRYGRSTQISPGSDGKRVLTYVDRVVDGVVQERELVEDKVVKQPVERVVLRGTGEAISDLDFDVPTDEYGRPLQYSYVLTNQVATGYSARPGARGASGLKLSEGYVAVRASDIPYGTKLYITSADNSFVYGYAIAADTGTGLMQGVIDVDLFYESYLESCLNGRRNVNIYVLG